MEKRATHVRGDESTCPYVELHPESRSIRCGDRDAQREEAQEAPFREIPRGPERQAPRVAPASANDRGAGRSDSPKRDQWICS